MQSSASPIIGDLKSEAAALAVEIAGVVSDNGRLPDALRQRFIAVRTELFKRGIFEGESISTVSPSVVVTL